MNKNPELCQRIIIETAKAYHMQIVSLKTSGYTDCVHARRCAMALIKDFVPGLSDGEVGLMFDGYGPATVKNGIRNYRTRAECCSFSRGKERQIRNALFAGLAVRTESDVLTAMGL